MERTEAWKRYHRYITRYRVAIIESRMARLFNQRDAQIQWLMVAALERGNVIHISKRMREHGYFIG